MRIVVFSGGTATNCLLPCFDQLALERRNEHETFGARNENGCHVTENGQEGSRDSDLQANECQVSYVIPVSDNGGSTSEILKWFGGVAVGDLRNRALCLFRNEARHQFLHHRLAKDSREAAREWDEIVQGTHRLWQLLQDHPADVVRLLSLHMKRFHDTVQASRLGFDYSTASLGNIFLKSLEMEHGIDRALELFLQFGDASENVALYPCVVVPERSDLSPKLANEFSGTSRDPSLDLQVVLSNGDTITGQSEISHPSSAAGTSSQMHFNKEDEHPRLVAAVQELRYVIRPSLEGNLTVPFSPKANNAAVERIRAADVLIFSVGSLITSLMPSLIVPEIASAISRNANAVKILMQNGSYDRESYGLDAYQYSELIISTLHRVGPSSIDPSSYLTHVIQLQDTEIRPLLVERSSMTAYRWKAVVTHNKTRKQFDADTLLKTLKSILL